MDWTKPLTLMADLISRDLGDEIVIMSHDGQEIHSFEETGLWVWKKIEQKISPDKILDEMVSEYAVKEEQGRKDLVSFFKELNKLGLLK